MSVVWVWVIADYRPTIQNKREEGEGVRLVTLFVLLAVLPLAHPHVHQWRLIDQYTNEDGDTVCSWLCDYTGLEYRIETVGCWNPND